jgi:uncharacterized protein (TIGR03435 family)
MIAFAYSIGNPSIQLLGVPEWARDQSYDVTAKPDAGFPALSRAENVAEVRLMMRGLLEERFGLKVHSENRPGRVLSMEVAKGGIKMKTVAEPRDPTSVGGGVDMALDDVTGHLISRGCTVSMLANGLAHWLKTPVLDRTGLMGSYAFNIHWNDPVTTPVAQGFGIGEVGLGLLISNVKSQLGLQLQKVNGSVEYWIVDQVKHPTPN